MFQATAKDLHLLQMTNQATPPKGQDTFEVQLSGKSHRLKLAMSAQQDLAGRKALWKARS